MMNLKSETQNPDMPKECAGCGKKITDRFVQSGFTFQNCLVKFIHIIIIRKTTFRR